MDYSFVGISSALPATYYCVHRKRGRIDTLAPHNARLKLSIGYAVEERV